MVKFYVKKPIPVACDYVIIRGKELNLLCMIAIMLSFVALKETVILVKVMFSEKVIFLLKNKKGGKRMRKGFKKEKRDGRRCKHDRIIHGQRKADKYQSWKNQF